MPVFPIVLFEFGVLGFGVAAPRVGLLPWQAIAGFHAAGLTAAAAPVMLKRPLRRRSVAKC